MHLSGSRFPAKSSSARLLAAVQRTNQQRPQLRRHEHHLRGLPYAVDGGLEPLFSKETLRMLSQDFQKGLLTRLNDMVKGTASEHASLAQTVINTAQDRNQILAFNLASEALNNSYFLTRLTSDLDRRQYKAGSALGRRISQDFGDFTAFKQAFSSAAEGMSGSGYLWLVVDKKKQLGILPTFGAGTPLVQARYQRGDPDDVLGEELKSLASAKEETPSEGSPAAATDGDSTRSAAQQLTEQVELLAAQEAGPQARAVYRAIVDEINPIMCLNVHERAWLQDHGVWGKEKYIQGFWNVLDWSRIEASFDKLNAGNPQKKYIS